MTRKFLKISVFLLVLVGSLGLTYHFAAAQSDDYRFMTEVPPEFWSWRCAASGYNGGCSTDNPGACLPLQSQFCPPCDPGTDFNFIWVNACQGTGSGSGPGGGLPFFWEQCFPDPSILWEFNYCGYNTGADCSCIKQYSQPDPSVCSDPTAINYGGSGACNYGTEPPPAQTYMTVSISPSSATISPGGSIANYTITVNKGGGPITQAAVNIPCNQLEPSYVGNVSPYNWPGLTCSYPEGNIVNFGAGNSASIPYQISALPEASVRTGQFKASAAAVGSCQGTCYTSTPLTLGVSWWGTKGSTCAAVSAPDTVAPGSSFTATIGMNNTGTAVWRPPSIESTTPTRLGSFNHYTNATDNLIWGISRIEATSNNVYPGQQGIYTYTFTAPSTPGTYPFDWKMVTDAQASAGGGWFGEYCGKDINVGTSASATANISANPQNIPWDSASTLTWSYANASSCTITPPASLSGYPSGSGTVSTGNLTTSKTYTISCNPPGPNSVSQTTVNVAPAPSIGLTVIKAGQGRVWSSPPGIDCGSGCSSQFEGGTTVTLTAEPGQGRIFTGWGEACSGSRRNPTCTINMTGSSKTVIANFAIDPNYKEF